MKETCLYSFHFDAFQLVDITAKQRSKENQIPRFNSEKRMPDVQQVVQVPKTFSKTY